jgi:hypothetical protein
MPKPLALSDAEITTIMAACRPPAVEAREPFLLAVAQTIAGLDEHADGAVYRICRELQCRFFEPPRLARVTPKWARRAGGIRVEADEPA